MPDSEDFSLLTSIRSDPLIRNHPDNVDNFSVEGIPTQFYMLTWHRDRLVSALKAFNRDSSIFEGDTGLKAFLACLEGHLEQKFEDSHHPDPLKVRFELTRNGTVHITSVPTAPVPSEALFPSTFSGIAYLKQPPNPQLVTCNVFIASAMTPRSLFTVHKTTNRAPYDEARKQLPFQLGLTPPDPMGPGSTFSAVHLAAGKPLTSTINGKHSAPKEEVLLVNKDFTEKPVVMEGSITSVYFCRNGHWITPEAGGHQGTTRRWALQTGLCRIDNMEVESVKEGEIVLLSNGVIGFCAGIIRKLPLPSD